MTLDAHPATEGDQPPRAPQPRRWIIAAVGLLLFCAMLVAGVRIYRVRGAVAAVRQHGGYVATLSDEEHPIRRAFGSEPLGYFDGPTLVVLSHTDISADDIRSLRPHLRQFDEVYGFGLANTAVTDDVVVILAEYEELRLLDLTNTDITDASLRELQKLRHLRRLQLDGTRITTSALKHLESLTQLERLSLDGTAVDDSGMQSLAKLSKLQYVSLSNTDVTDSGAEVLHSANPALDITDD